MKHSTVVTVLRAFVLAVAFAATGFERIAYAQDNDAYEPGEVVVKLSQASDLAEVATTYGLASEPLAQFGSRPIYRLRIVDGSLPPAKAEALAGDSRVLYAEPNFVQQAPEGQQRVSWARGDTGADYATQWAGDYLGLPAAHTIVRGAGVTVAVLDTGIDDQHPAFAGRLLPGFDFVDMDGDPGEVGIEGTDPVFGHGTHVAGLVALAAPDAKILPVRVLDRDGAGNIWVLAEALAYAVNPDGDPATDDGAHVINLSLSTQRRTNLIGEIARDVICADDDDGGDDGTDGVQTFAELDDDDCLAFPGRTTVVVAAAGNSASSTPEYPAAEAIPGLLAVGAIASDGSLATFSNHGAWVSVVAPGDAIVSSVPAAGYGTWSGTSMATPLVAGQAALIRSADATLRAPLVAARIQDSAAPGSAGEPRRADAAASLGLPPTDRSPAPGGDDNPAPSPDESAFALFLPSITR